MMALDRDEDVSRVLTRGTPGALPPAPAARADDARFVDEDHFAAFRVLDLAISPILL